MLPRCITLYIHTFIYSTCVLHIRVHVHVHVHVCVHVVRVYVHVARAYVRAARAYVHVHVHTEEPHFLNQVHFGHYTGHMSNQTPVTVYIRVDVYTGAF